MLRLPSAVVTAAWLRDHLDHPDLRILDVRWSLGGPPGRDAYRAGHLPGAVFLDLDRDLSAPPGAGRHPLPDAGRLAAASLARRRDAGAAILDARAAERYRGEVEPIDPRAGHIPGARSAPWSGNLDRASHFLAPLLLRDRYATLGARPGGEPIAYCGSGVNATQALLALHLAGIEGRLYAGSWSDWASHDELPAAIGAEA